MDFIGRGNRGNRVNVLKHSLEVRYITYPKYGRQALGKVPTYSEPRQPYDSKVLKAITGTCRPMDDTDRDSTSERIL